MFLGKNINIGRPPNVDVWMFCKESPYTLQNKWKPYEDLVMKCLM